jgi:hypothetical protein
MLKDSYDDIDLQRLTKIYDQSYPFNEKSVANIKSFGKTYRQNSDAIEYNQTSRCGRLSAKESLVSRQTY